MLHLRNIRSPFSLPPRSTLPLSGRIPRAFPRFNRSPKIDDARSDLVLQETTLFIYQLQYDTRLQQAMTLEAYDAAKVFKKQRDDVDSLLEKFQSQKGPNSGATPLSDAFMESTTSGLTLRLDLNKAIEEERYEDAAQIRDQISKLSDQIENSQVEGSEIVSDELLFDLGQLVEHKVHNYRGVICGYDKGCCESEEWKSNQSTPLSAQPFYHVLVDERDWPAYTGGPPMAYVPQDDLREMQGDLESEKSNFKTIRHPFVINMFLGKDNLGGYIPSMPLRNKYKINRKDVYPSSEQDDV